MKQAILILSVLMLFGFSQFSDAQPGHFRGPDAPPHPKMMGDEPLPPMMFGPGKCLDLTDEQSAKIADLRLAMKKEMLPLRSDFMTKRNELKILLTADTPDQSKINQKIDQMAELRKQMQKKRVNHMMEVRSLLTAEQKKQFDTMILSGGHSGFHGPGKEARHHPRPGPMMK